VPLPVPPVKLMLPPESFSVVVAPPVMFRSSPVVPNVAQDLGYDLNGNISDAGYFILSRELERLLLEKIFESKKDIVYIVPKYTPDIKKTVNDILKKNSIKADLVVGLLMI
jgi:hypothetical protein